MSASPPMPTLPTRWDWRPKLRWFAAEIVVVVAGVLIALALNAWWGARQDAARERVYLTQLAEDLRETERIMDQRDARMAALTGGAVDKLLVSFGTAARPPRDSVVAWLANVAYLATPRPVLGTTEALMASGDFGAIRDDDLVAAITAYYDVNREYLADQDRQVQRAHAHGEALALQYLDRQDVYRSEFEDRTRPDRATPLLVVPPGWTAPFPLDVDAFYRDPVAYRHLMLLRRNVEYLASSRRVMRQAAVALREQVDTELNR